MMMDWNNHRASLMERVADYAKDSPDVLKGLMAIDAAGRKTGHLEPKIHELIALAVSVTMRCDGCISTHTKKAVELGATRAEIAEALGVAVAMNAGAAMVYSAHVIEAYEQLPKQDIQQQAD